MKLNAVALRGINEDELASLAHLSRFHKMDVRFIEEMPIGRHHDGKNAPLLVPEIQERLSDLGELVSVENGDLDGPAERFRIEGARGEIGFISALSRHFCSRCNRLRLTSHGRLRACLLSDATTDIRTPLRSGASDAELAEVFHAAILHKKAEHDFTPESPEMVKTAMQKIGG